MQLATIQVAASGWLPRSVLGSAADWRIAMKIRVQEVFA
jgi:hypothetical protein